jgi:hypothetical protein
MTDDALESGSEPRALELLPWYVNGTLAGKEREEVGRALRSSLTCRLECARLRRLQQLMQQDDPELVATDRGFERLISRIHRQRRWRGVPLWQAAAVVLVAFGLALWWNLDSRSPSQDFVTLTTPEDIASNAVRLRVVFVSVVPEDARRELLAAHGLEIAAPPTPDGVYTVTVPEGADARAISNALRTDARVAFTSTPPVNEPR